MVELVARPGLLDLVSPDLAVALMRYIGAVPERETFIAIIDAIKTRH